MNTTYIRCFHVVYIVPFLLKLHHEDSIYLFITLIGFRFYSEKGVYTNLSSFANGIFWITEHITIHKHFMLGVLILHLRALLVVNPLFSISRLFLFIYEKGSLTSFNLSFILVIHLLFPVNTHKEPYTFLVAFALTIYLVTSVDWKIQLIMTSKISLDLESIPLGTR